MLSRYVGWGGLADAFDQDKENWRAEYAELKELLTPEEYEAARKDFFDCAERANLDKVAERWTTDMYRAEPGTSERTDL